MKAYIEEFAETLETTRKGIKVDIRFGIDKDYYNCIINYKKTENTINSLFITSLVYNDIKVWIGDYVEIYGHNWQPLVAKLLKIKPKSITDFKEITETLNFEDVNLTVQWLYHPDQTTLSAEYLSQLSSNELFLTNHMQTVKLSYLKAKTWVLTIAEYDVLSFPKPKCYFYRAYYDAYNQSFIPKL